MIAWDEAEPYENDRRRSEIQRVMEPGLLGRVRTEEIRNSGLLGPALRARYDGPQWEWLTGRKA